MSPTLRYYIEDRVGHENADKFENWAFGKTHDIEVRSSRILLLEWNKKHYKLPISMKKSLWDSVDKMIQIWKEKKK